MRFTELFIRKPVLSIVLSLLLLMVGLVSYFKLPVRLYPMISSTVISISTAYPGASAETMESYVTSPIERSLAGINGVNYITSNSGMGSSSVSVKFKLGVDINQAVSDVRDKVASARYQLPKKAYDPIITKMDPNSDPIMFISFTSDNLSPEQMTDYLKRIVQPGLETINGVGEAKILGERGYTMRILLNPQQMANNNVTAQEIVNEISQNQIHPPSGRLKSAEEEYEVSAQTDVSTEKSFNQLIISTRDNHLTRLQDVGRAKLAPNNVRSSFTINGQNGIVVGLIARSDGNPLTIAADTKKLLTTIQNKLPSDMKANVVWDNSAFIASSIKEVKRTIFEATLFVVFVMFLFLGSLRMLSIPLVTIPLSLIGIFSIMLAMGFSINTMTLLAMVLAIGLVVDDAIVVAENIHRHIEDGLSPKEAAIKGSHEIQFAIISMTITLAAVFTPIGFLTGLTGSLFKEFAFALAGTVIISGFIALTLSPMMCAKVINAQSLNGRLPKMINRVFEHIASIYRTILNRALKFRVLVPLLLIISVPLDLWLYNGLAQELAPKEDVGVVFTTVSGPPNANIEYTEQYTRQMAPILNAVPEKNSLGIINGSPGVNSAMSFLTLKPWSERRRSTQDIANELNVKLAAIPGITAFALNPFSLPGASGMLPVHFVLQTTGSYQDLLDASDTIISQMKQNPMFLNVSSSFKMDTPQITIHIDRDLAGDLGIPMSAISNTIHYGLGKPQIAEFSMGGRSYNVVPELDQSFREKPTDINQLYVRSKFGNLVPLSNLVTLKEEIKPKTLQHFDQLRSVKITAGLTPGHDLGEAINYLQDSAKLIEQDNIQYDFSGESRQFLSASNEVMFTFVFALLFIILLLSAQFESFISPFVVLCGLFFSITGALGALKLAHYSSNIYTQIGLVTLIGLISKHGILIVEFANQLRAKGHSALDAILDAAQIRLRPILMTTAAMVLGAYPLLLASGAGAVSRKEIGLVIVSGMSVGTVMTLFIVPAIYLLVEDIKARLTKKQPEQTPGQSQAQ